MRFKTWITLTRKNMVFLSKQLRKNLLKMKNFREVYDFHRMVRVCWDAKRYKCNDIRFDKKTRKKLRSPLTVGEKVLVLAERLRKKDAPRNLYKSTTQNISFFNREEIFIVRNVLLRRLLQLLDLQNGWQRNN